MHYTAPPPKVDLIPVTHHERLGYWVESDMAVHLLQQYRLEVPAGYQFITPIMPVVRHKVGRYVGARTYKRAP